MEKFMPAIDEFRLDRWFYQQRERSEEAQPQQYFF